MMTRHFLFCTLLLGIVGVNAQGEELAFTFYALGDLAEGCMEKGTIATDVNDLGVVTGGTTVWPECDFPQADAHAFIWVNGVMTDVDALAEGLEIHTAYSVSRDGSVLFGIGAYPDTAVILQDGVVEALDIPKGCELNWSPFRMNRNGTMGAGTCDHASGIYTILPAVYFLEDGGSIVLDPLPDEPGIYGYARDVNDDGVVVGYYVVESGLRAFIWQQGVLTELENTLGGGESIAAYAISDTGFISGVATGADGLSSTMRYDLRTGEMIDLGGNLAAIDVNDRGDAVGPSIVDGNRQIPALYMDNQVIPLGDYLPIEYWLCTPWTINNYGWIVGEAYDADFTTIWGWLLVPIYDKGDYDGDGDVDLQDFGHFQRCFGAEPYIDGTLHVGCSVFDFDDDVDLDLDDYAAFQSAFTGALE
ncbi:MAG: hypothetical protein IID37_02535 [Planctomycetes bacterium]|nr:hypothetical protein [Planctomycetota bacterium]